MGVRDQFHMWVTGIESHWVSHYLSAVVGLGAGQSLCQYCRLVCCKVYDFLTVDLQLLALPSHLSPFNLFPLLSSWLFSFLPSVPKPPRNARVISSNSSSANITWDPPEDALKAVVTYEVTYFAKFWNERETVANVTSNSHTFFNLRPGTSYTFSIVTISGIHKSNSVPTSKTTGKSCKW